MDKTHKVVTVMLTLNTSKHGPITLDMAKKYADELKHHTENGTFAVRADVEYRVLPGD